MFNLIRNENMKLYRRVGTWVMIGIIILGVILMAVMTNVSNNKFHDPDWKQNLQENTKQMKEALRNNNVEKEFVEETQNEIKIDEYRIKHNMDPNKISDIWNYMNGALPMISLITVFTVIVGSGSIASEFAWGTIKLLMIRPVSRTRILLSKYLTMLIFALTLLIGVFVLTFLAGGLLYGFSGVGQPDLVVTDGQVVEKSMFVNILLQYGAACVSLIMTVTIAFTISTLFKNSGMAIGISLVSMFMGSTIVGILSSKYEWAKYILFANMDLSQYIGTQGPIIKGMTLSFSVIMLIIYFVIFNFLSWIVFTKKDIRS